jgi:3-deoxy-D-manno-octulosonic-acid transferase
MLEQNASDLSYRFKSESDTFAPLDILVADTNGELRVLTQLSDLAFIGKSLPPCREGQTPIECGLLGVPMVFGPGMSNFRSVCEGMIQMGAAIQLSDVNSLREVIESLALDEAARREMTQRQSKWAAASRGALARTFVAIVGFVRDGGPK